VDYDDEHSAISIGVKKSAIKKPTKKDVKKKRPIRVSKSKREGHKRQKRQYISEQEPPPVHVVSNGVPYVDSASTITSGLHTNMMNGGVSTHAKVPTMAGVPGANVVLSKQQPEYFMGNQKSNTMIHKKHHHKSRNNIMTADNGGNVASATPMQGMESMGGGMNRVSGMNGASAMNGMSNMNEATSMNGMNNMNGASTMNGMSNMNGASTMNGMSNMNEATSMNEMSNTNGMSDMNGINAINEASNAMNAESNAVEMSNTNGINGFTSQPGMTSPATEEIQDINGGTESSMEQVGKPMMNSFASNDGYQAQELDQNMEGTMENSPGSVINSQGGKLITNVVKHMGNKIDGDDKSIDQAMAEEDKMEAETSARNSGNSGNLLKSSMEEGSFKANNSNGDVSESNVLDNPNGENGESPAEEEDSYDDDDDNDEKNKDKEADSRTTNDDTTDLNQEIGDQVVKNNGHMTGHDNMNIVHGTPCTDCHVAGAIGHGAVISGSEAKKIGLNDEAYLKRLGIKECKIKGPGFSEGNHGGAISDEWAQKLDGFDKKYLLQLGIPEEALEGNSATRDCKFVERIAEVLQAQDKSKNNDNSAPKDEVETTKKEEPEKEKETKKEKEQTIKTKADAKKLIKDVEKLQKNLLDADNKALKSEENETIASEMKDDENKEANSKADDPDTKPVADEATNSTEEIKEDTDKLDDKPAEEKKGDENKVDENNKAVENEEDVNKNPVEKEETSGDGKPESSTAFNSSKDNETVSDEAWADFVQMIHENCTVRSANKSAINTTHIVTKEDLPVNKTEQKTVNSEQKTPGETFIKALTKNMTTENGTLKTKKPEDLEILKRKHAVSKKMKHLEELKTKLKQLNTGILRSKITADTRSIKSHHVAEDEENDKTSESATRSYKAKLKKLQQKRRRKYHLLKKNAD